MNIYGEPFRCLILRDTPKRYELVVLQGRNETIILDSPRGPHWLAEMEIMATLVAKNTQSEYLGYVPDPAGATIFE